MARFLVRLTDKTDPPTMKRGEVIDVRPDDFDWRKTELSIGWDWRGDAALSDERERAAKGEVAGKSVASIEQTQRERGYRGTPDLWDHYGVFDFPAISLRDGYFFLAVWRDIDPKNPKAQSPRAIAYLDIDALPKDTSKTTFDDLLAVRIRKPEYDDNGDAKVFGPLSDRVFG